MYKELKLQIKEFRRQYRLYREYLKETDWTKDINVKDVYKTEESIIKNMLKDISNFQKENSPYLHLKEVQSFFKMCNEIIQIHLKRIDNYISSTDWSATTAKERKRIQDAIEKLEKQKDTENKELLKQVYLEELAEIEKQKQEEIRFQNSIFTQGREVRMTTLTLKIETNNSTLSPKLFYGDKKASLIMRSFLYDRIGYIKERSDTLKVKWDNPNPKTSRELYINMNPKDIPPYDEDRHFFEQPESTISFWEEEIKKIKNGVNIGGYKMSGLIYTGINYGNINKGTQENRRIEPVDLTDNLYYIDELLKEAVSKNIEGVFLYGSRRVSKSVGESLYLLQGLLSIVGGSSLLAGFSATDLGHVNSYLETMVNHLPPALKPNININSEKEFSIGLKGQTAQQNLDMSTITIVNLDGGSNKNATQKFAGFTPDRIVIDEGSKGNLILPWLALRPAITASGDGKNRTVALIAATAGEASLSKHAEKMIKNPETYGLLPANYDLLEKISDPEFITWGRKTFVSFMPAQMSYDSRKIDSKFVDFLQKVGVEVDAENKELKKINIKVSDWEYGKKHFEEKRKKAENDYAVLASETASFPLDTDDVYLSGDKNPYNAVGIKKHINWLKENGKTGKKYWFETNTDGELVLTPTNSPIIEQYPFGGGNFDAPVIVYEELTSQPPFGLYVLGLDDVKHDTSDGDSVISATVYKRGWELSEWSDRIVCTLATRPSRKEEAYKTIRLIMKYYNAIVFPENDDEGFKDFLERRYSSEAILHLAEGVDFSRSLDMHYNRNRPIGYASSARNNNRLNSRVLAYTQEPVEKNTDLDGYQKINDVMLLEEMANNKPGANADRIRSFGLSLIYAEYLDKHNLYIRKSKGGKEDYTQTVKKGVTRRGGLSRRRIGKRRPF